MLEEKTLTLNDRKELEKKYGKEAEKQIEKVKKGYPVQYLIGNVPFYNCTIEVNENVLIPRFETEYLIEKIVKKMKEYQKKPLSVIDIGTGSGCIAISLDKNTQWHCLGVDIDQFALSLAQKNNKINKTNVGFKYLDILKEELEEYDIYISNPPYISKSEQYDKSILYEPHIALFAEQNGLEFYEAILSKIKNKPLLIAFEIGETQGLEIKKKAKNFFPTAKITIEKDLCGKDRYLFIENNH